MPSSEEGMEEVLPCLEFGVQDSAKKKGQSCPYPEFKVMQ